MILPVYLVVSITDKWGYKLDFASTMLHEGVHALLFKEMAEHDPTLDPNDKPRIFDYYSSFNGWIDENGKSTGAQHYYMEENYVKPIARAIQKLDNNNYPLEYYMAYGWEGLNKYGESRNNITSDEMDEYYRLQAIVNNNSKFNGYDCD